MRDRDEIFNNYQGPVNIMCDTRPAKPSGAADAGGGLTVMRISIAAFAFCGLGATTALSTSAAVGSVTHSTLVYQMCNSYNNNRYVYAFPQNLTSVSASLTTGDFNVVVELYNASLTQMIANGFGNSDANTSITTFSGAFISAMPTDPYNPGPSSALYSECTSTVLKLDPTGTGLAKIVCKVYDGTLPTACTATYSFAPAEKGQIEQSTHE